MPLGRLAPSSVWQVSGESTPSAKLPDKYVSTPQPSSPLASTEWFASETPADHTVTPVVDRHERTVGMRYQYVRGATRIPVEQGTTVTARRGVNVNNSAFQPNEMGPIHDGGYNDALFQAGYPGFNLGLSFKVQTLPRTLTGPGYNMHANQQVILNNRSVNRLTRPSGAPPERSS